ncbi:UPF0652 protein [Diplonema papillatum]|nr:UPF0652 protein [Diplonema papillatum]
MKELYNLFLGLYTSDAGVERGLEMSQQPDLSLTGPLIQHVFELSRRYKIMNCEIMRYEYGKLLHIMQDAATPDIAEHLGFNPVTPIVTVASRAKALGVDAMLSDPDLALATTPVPRLRSISELNRALRTKDVTVKSLIQRYSRVGKATAEAVEQLIRSIDDANCYTRDNSLVISRMIEQLSTNFSPDAAEPGLALAIDQGSDGSRLSHAHHQQYVFVLQSLSLWKNITKNMYQLWLLMETDFLSPEAPYSLEDTGQGLNRRQQAPHLYEAMQGILKKTKEEVGDWIGSDRVHMGDKQVPNGYAFIDKYTQVARIINPILRCIDGIDAIVKDKEHKEYIEDVWATPKNLKKAILCDFFKHGFDGSGGDNDTDAGSCIDGRLTSAWNWCNSLRSKPFYPIFLLTGVGSFDGSFE